MADVKAKTEKSASKTKSVTRKISTRTASSATARGDASKKAGFAVLETGGKQYRVASGDIIRIEKLPGEPKKGDAVSFDKVLLVHDGKEIFIGKPYLADRKIEGTLEEIGRGKKVDVIKFKPKVRYRKKYGHRQPYMKVKIK